MFTLEKLSQIWSVFSLLSDGQFTTVIGHMGPFWLWEQFSKSNAHSMFWHRIISKYVAHLKDIYLYFRTILKKWIFNKTSLYFRKFYEQSNDRFFENVHFVNEMGFCRPILDLAIKKSHFWDFSLFQFGLHRTLCDAIKYSNINLTKIMNTKHWKTI